jgi:hypothetical protein
VLGKLGNTTSSVYLSRFKTTNLLKKWCQNIAVRCFSFYSNIFVTCYRFADGVKAASRFKQRLTTAGTKLRQALAKYNGLTCPNAGFPVEMTHESVLSADNNQWAAFLDPTAPSLHRTAIDALHTCYRASDEIDFCVAEVRRLAAHIEERQEQIASYLLKLVECDFSSRSVKGCAALLRRQLMGLSRYASLSSAFKCLDPEIQERLPDFTSSVTCVDPFLESLVSLSGEEDVAYDVDIEQCSDEEEDNEDNSEHDPEVGDSDEEEPNANGERPSSVAP